MQWTPYDTRETTIVVPRSIDPTTRDNVEGIMFDQAGGFTRLAAVGGWRNTEEHNDEVEDVLVYTIAGLSADGLETIAQALLAETVWPRQNEIYVVKPNGTAGVFTRGSQVTASDPAAYERALEAVENGAVATIHDFNPADFDGREWDSFEAFRGHPELTSSARHKPPQQKPGVSMNGQAEVYCATCTRY